MTLQLLTLLALTLAQDPPAREKASSITYVRPKGWNRQEYPNGAVGLIPPDPDGRQCSLYILPGQRGDLNDLVWHTRIFQAMTQGSQVVGQPEKAYRDNWQYTRVKTVNAQRQDVFVAVYTKKVDDRLEALVFSAATEELFKSYRFAVERLLIGIEFPGSRPPPPTGLAEWTPAPVPDKSKEIKLVGAWLVARMELVFSADPKFGAQKQMQTLKVVALYENKVAAKLDARSTGLNDSTYPAEGLATLDVSDPKSLGANNRRFGSWSEEDGKIRIHWNQGPEDVVEHEGDNLKGNGILWSALKPLEGIRLDGTYARTNWIGLAPSIVLRKDGTFDADQVNETMGGKQVNAKMPEIGSGTYEFHRWSLILRFDTGFVQSIHVDFDGPDPATSKSILINGFAFERSGAASGAAAVAAPRTPLLPPVTTVAHGLVLPLPADWQRRDDPAGGVVFFPPQNQNPTGYYLIVGASQRLQGTPQQAHQGMARAAVAWAQLGNDAKIVPHPEGAGEFLWTTITGKTAAGEAREVQVFTAAHDGQLEAVTTANHVDLDAVLPILKGTTFKKPGK